MAEETERTESRQAQRDRAKAQKQAAQSGTATPLEELANQLAAGEDPAAADDGVVGPEEGGPSQGAQGTPEEVDTGAKRTVSQPQVLTAEEIQAIREEAQKAAMAAFPALMEAELARRQANSLADVKQANAQAQATTAELTQLHELQRKLNPQRQVDIYPPPEATAVPGMVAGMALTRPMVGPTGTITAEGVGVAEESATIQDPTSASGKRIPNPRLGALSQ